LGEINEKRSEYADASEYLKASLDIARSRGDNDISARALQGRGVVAMAQAQYEDAERFLNEALVLAREIRDVRLECDIETRLGWLERGLGKFKQSRERTEKALDLARSHGYTNQIAELELSLGVLDFLEKNYEDAKKHDEEGLVHAGEDKRLQCALHQALGGVEIELGNFDEAEAQLMKSLHLAIETGLRWYNSVIWKEIGRLRLKQQLPNAAASAFKKSLDLAREVNSPERMGAALYGLAQVAALQGNLAEARLQGQTSLNIYESTGHHRLREVKEWVESLSQ